MFRIKNSTNGNVRMKIDGTEVEVLAGGETKVEDSIGRKLQEYQPQLECSYEKDEVIKPAPIVEEKKEEVKKLRDKKNEKRKN